MDHRSVGVTRVRFAVLDHKAGIADPESRNAATEFPCCLIPCAVFFVSPVVPAACDLLLCAGAGIDAGEGAFWDVA